MAASGHRTGPAATSPLSRRLFVRGIGKAGAVLWLGPLAACAPDPPRTGEPDARSPLDAGPDSAAADAGLARGDASVDAVVGEAGQVVEAGADGAPLPAGSPCSPLLTPLERFPALFGGDGTVDDWQKPDLKADSYRLSVEGLVSHPLELSLSELTGDAGAQVTVLRTLQCVYGARGTALWRGVSLRSLLERAGIDRGAAKRIHFVGADGFVNNLRLDDVFGPAATEPRHEPLLVFEIGGQPLPRDLGYPVRLLLPDRYGYKNIKWLTRVEVTDADDEVGQYQLLGFDDRAQMGPSLRFATERELPLPAAGKLRLCLRALSGYGPIESVEISIDEAPFQPARLLPLERLRAGEPALDTALQVRGGWSFPLVGVASLWFYDWEPSPGEHLVALRTRDGSGRSAEGYEFTLTIES